MLLLLKEESSASVDKRPKQIIVMAGQSNMAGRGGVVWRKFDNDTSLKVWDGSVPPESHPNPNVYRFNEEFQWEPAKEPVHAGIGCTTTCGIGIGMAFANHLLALDPDFGPIGLVPCAAGGTSLKNWTTPTDYPYPSLLYRTKMAIRKGGILRAVLWFQGESDSKYYSFGKSYDRNLRLLVSKLRTDLESPMLPWVQVIIPHQKPPFEGPLIEDVRKAQMGLDLPNVVKVDGDGLPMQRDGVHLTIEGYVKLGRVAGGTKTSSRELNMNASKEREYINEEGAVETKVESTKYESPPWQQPPRKEAVEVIHLRRTDENPGVGGAMADAATKLADTINSAKETGDRND
ncbi:unnamed protein product [Cuscuta campestris]|uniref:Sialate O-acetylesterase domain-containing protein n=2 Tax=Cuscuta sect. Cleistogrammica TaxID=1824901 RepID=A0A484KBS2_9ASTE|nr:unnamed protein product [Cuscuta campestris]